MSLIGMPTSSMKSAGGNISATATIANALAAGSIVPLELTWESTIGKLKEIIIPTSEAWLLTDCYVVSTADSGTDVNPKIEIRKDNDRLLDTSQLLLTVLITSAQRPNGLHGNLLFEGGSHMTMRGVTSKLAGAARAIDAVFPYEKTG